MYAMLCKRKTWASITHPSFFPNISMKNYIYNFVFMQHISFRNIFERKSTFSPHCCFMLSIHYINLSWNGAIFFFSVFVKMRKEFLKGMKRKEYLWTMQKILKYQKNRLNFYKRYFLRVLRSYFTICRGNIQESFLTTRSTVL